MSAKPFFLTIPLILLVSGALEVPFTATATAGSVCIGFSGVGVCLPTTERQRYRSPPRRHSKPARQQARQPAAPAYSFEIAKGIQYALTILGYPVGAIDGRIGRQTRDQIRRYQADNGLAVGAVLSKPEIEALFAKAQAVVDAGGTTVANPALGPLLGPVANLQPDGQAPAGGISPAAAAPGGETGATTGLGPATGSAAAAGSGTPAAGGLAPAAAEAAGLAPSAGAPEPSGPSRGLVPAPSRTEANIVPAGETTEVAALQETKASEPTAAATEFATELVLSGAGVPNGDAVASARRLRAEAEQAHAAMLKSFEALGSSLVPDPEGSCLAGKDEALQEHLSGIRSIDGEYAALGGNSPAQRSAQLLAKYCRAFAYASKSGPGIAYADYAAYLLGERSAALYVAIDFIIGDGVPTSRESAEEWLTRAIREGEKGSKERNEAVALLGAL